MHLKNVHFVLNLSTFGFCDYIDAIINERGEILNEIEMHCYMGFQGDLIEFYGGSHFTGGVHYLNAKGVLVIPKEE